MYDARRRTLRPVSTATRLNETWSPTMKNIRSSAIVAAVLLLAFSMAPATALAQSNPNKPAWKVLHFFERSDGTIAYIDNGAPGPSIGDRLVFSSPIFDAAGCRSGATERIA
jgi:hypothetical protein